MLGCRVIATGAQRFVGASTIATKATTSTSLHRLRLQPHLQTNTAVRRLADIARPTQPVTKSERLALRAARKERASQVLQQAKGMEGEAAAAGSSSSSSARGVLSSKYLWYASVGVPSILLVWGFSDSNSPPAKFCRMIGLTGLVESYTQEIAKPSHDKLLPDWSQVRRDVWETFVSDKRHGYWSHSDAHHLFPSHGFFVCRCQTYPKIFPFLIPWC